MSSGIDLHWNLFLTSRNKFGFVMFYGHGGLLRTKVWEEIGGFPELTSEDIAFASKARELGYYGKFLSNVVAKEAFPDNYQQFLRREIKVVKGVLEFISTCVPSFLRSKKVSWIEKFDLIITNFSLFLHFPFIIFLIFANVILPIIFAKQAFPNSQWYTALSNMDMEVLGANMSSLWTWDFYIITLISILSPLAYQLPRFLKNPLRIMRYALHSTTNYLSLSPVLFLSIVSYFINRKCHFIVTGNRGSAQISLSFPHANLFLGILLTIFGILIYNFALLTVSLSFLFIIFMNYRFVNYKIVRLFAIIPYLFFVSVFIATPFLLLGVTGATAMIVPQHH